MNLKQLEMFAKVSRHGSFSKAAKELGIAQSLISRSISLLENDWGDRLFERTGRGVHLTEFGRRVLPHTEALLLQSSRLNDQVRGRAGIVSGEVRIGILPSLTAKVIPQLFAEVSARAPSIKLQIAESLNGTLDKQLSSGELDMAILNRHTPCTKEDLLGHLRTYLVGRADHELVQDPTIDFKRLENIPLVVPVRPSALRSVLDHHAKRKQINLNIVVEVESLAAMIEITHTGKALTILPKCGIENELQSGRLKVAEIVNPTIPRSITLSATQEHPLSRAGRLVHQVVREIAPRLLSEAPANTSIQAGQHKTDALSLLVNVG